jgi:hypothetical protein
MATNFLEQLIAEWYEYNDYFVRRNVLVGKRAEGGHESELDIVAFNPSRQHLVHVEPSMDANSWAVRETRYKKKFEAGRKYIPKLFTHLPLPSNIEQIAVLVFASKTNHDNLGGGKVVLIDDLLEDIFLDLKNKHLASSAIPEHLTILRSFQFVAEYKQTVFKALGQSG